jgi:hypothetical protein
MKIGSSALYYAAAATTTIAGILHLMLVPNIIGQGTYFMSGSNRILLGAFIVIIHDPPSKYHPTTSPKLDRCIFADD